MTENDNNHTEKEKSDINENAAFIVGGGLLLSGLIIAVIILVNYNCRDNQLLLSYFKKDDGLSDLSNALLGTTGLLWSLGGTIFFIYTIIQTRTEIQLQISEMKQTNESLISQRYQTTFFNLLDNHTRLISNLPFEIEYGNAGIENLTNKCINGYNRFIKYYDEGVFPNFKISAHEHPFNLINTHKNSIESYISNFRTVVNFIENKLDEKEFYFELLYNYLSIGEKFLLGLYINLHRNENQFFIENHKFNFLKYYYSNETVFRYDSHTYFPAVFLDTEIKQHVQYNYLGLMNNEKIFDYVLYYDVKLYDEILKLNTIDVEIHQNREMIHGKHFMCFENVEPGLRISELNDFLKSFLAGYRVYDQIVAITIKFRFEYGNVEKSMLYWVNFQRKPSNTNNPENDYYDFTSSHK